MDRRDIVVIGASAGGINALRQLAAGLPQALPAAIFVVTHLPASGPSFLAQLLQDSCDLPVTEACDGESIEQGHMYVAPPDRHLLLEHDNIHLARGPKEGQQRPCINVTFRSAAVAFGARVVGVVLTGLLDDGTAGMWEIKSRDGFLIVQDPDEAAFASMPVSVLQEMKVDLRLTLSEIGPTIARLASGAPVPAGEFKPPVPPALIRSSGITCPDCRGPIWERDLGFHTGFRCQTGHTYSEKSLLEEHTASQERKLCEAVRTLDEGADVLEHVAGRQDGGARKRLEAESQQLRGQARDIRDLMEQRKLAPVA